jgi:hypothetical protein
MCTVNHVRNLWPSYISFRFCNIDIKESVIYLGNLIMEYWMDTFLGPKKVIY